MTSSAEFDQQVLKDVQTALRVELPNRESQQIDIRTSLGTSNDDVIIRHPDRWYGFLRNYSWYSTPAGFSSIQFSSTPSQFIHSVIHSSSHSVLHYFGGCLNGEVGLDYKVGRNGIAATLAEEMVMTSSTVIMPSSLLLMTPSSNLHHFLLFPLTNRWWRHHSSWWRQYD